MSRDINRSNAEEGEAYRQRTRKEQRSHSGQDAKSSKKQQDVDQTQQIHDIALKVSKFESKRKRIAKK